MLHLQPLRRDCRRGSWDGGEVCMPGLERVEDVDPDADDISMQRGRQAVFIGKGGGNLTTAKARSARFGAGLESS